MFTIYLFLSDKIITEKLVSNSGYNMTTFNKCTDSSIQHIFSEVKDLAELCRTSFPVFTLLKEEMKLHLPMTSLQYDHLRQLKFKKILSRLFS